MKIVAYYRVSTKRQGESGLGLEAQQAAVEAYAKANGATILKAFKEVESGKRADRPELAKAMTHARATRAKLVIAKLDRLARNVAFLSSLMETKIDFVACDNPCADRFTIHVLACVAEKEARDISARTTAALNAYKARGGLLGASLAECRNLTEEAAEEGRKAGAAANAAKARDAYTDLLPMMREMREQGATYRGMADRLNGEGFTTRRGGPWSHVQVRLVLERGEG